MSYIKNKIIVLFGATFFCNVMGIDTAFTFDISKNGQPALVIEIDSYSDNESSYDAICDRSPVIRAPFYKRILTRLYLFWYCNYLRMKKFAAERYRVLRQETTLFFKALSNRIKQLRRKAL